MDQSISCNSSTISHIKELGLNSSKIWTWSFSANASIGRSCLSPRLRLGICFGLFPVQNNKAAYNKAHTRLSLPGENVCTWFPIPWVCLYLYVSSRITREVEKYYVPQDSLVVTPAETTGSVILSMYCRVLRRLASCIVLPHKVPDCHVVRFYIRLLIVQPHAFKLHMTFSLPMTL